MNIEIISGSPRTNSVTKRVALNLEKWLEQTTDHEIGLINLQDWNLPPVQTVFQSVEKTPQEFKPLSERMFNADAFILVSPEYNGGYSPAMKNLLDHFPKQHHKPFGIVTASPGAMGGIRASQQMQLLIMLYLALHRPICWSFRRWIKNSQPTEHCWMKVFKTIFTTLSLNSCGWQKIFTKKEFWQKQFK